MMNSHLTYEEVLQIVDDTLGGVERDRLMSHASVCRRCSALIAQEREMVRAMKTAPLSRVSRRFTKAVMERVLPPRTGSALFRILGGGGRILAMAVVLAAVGYALSLNFPGSGTESRLGTSELMEDFNQAYQSVVTAFSNQSKQVARGVAEAADSKQWEIAGMILAAFVVLALIDRFIVKTLMRSKS